MTPEVFFTPFESGGESDNINRRVPAMLDAAGFFENITGADSVAVKIHPGEKNNVTYIRPSLVRAITRTISGRGASPFVTETTTLYCRERYTADELRATSAWNGFSEQTMGCPFLVADAEPDTEVAVPGEYLNEVGVAGGIAGAGALVVLTHVTGHSWTAGLAGSIKQLGMGCTGRKTKADVHLSTAITIDQELCISCGECARTCKGDAVDTTGEFAVLTADCVRCGVCIGSCEQEAIGYSHDYDRFARALAEAAAGVLSCFDARRVVFVNFLADLTWHCDCEGFSDKPIFPDLGVLVSSDPVAIDQASADLLNSSTPLRGSRADRPETAAAGDKLLALFGIEWWRQLDYCESLGAGSRDYKLQRLEH